MAKSPFTGSPSRLLGRKYQKRRNPQDKLEDMAYSSDVNESGSLFGRKSKHAKKSKGKK